MADLDAVPWADFRDPNFRWSDGPHAPRRPPKSNRECKRQIVWPRDKKQKGAHTWSRFTDILSGKGPDMWAGKQGDDGPNRQAWTHWGYGLWSHLQGFDNMGYHNGRDNWPGDPDHWVLGRRPTTEKYDFKTRKYKRPRPGDWSDVKWDRQGRDWLYRRHVDGTPEYSDFAWLTQTQRERDLGLLPYRYYPITSSWDWHHNERPWDWAHRLDRPLNHLLHPGRR